MDLLGETLQIFDGLRGHVVEVNDVANGVQQREEQRRAGSDLVELDVGVQRDVLLDRELFQLGDKVAGIEVEL